MHRPAEILGQWTPEQRAAFLARQEEKDMERETLLTPEEAAERLNVSPRTIREWLRTGRLRGVKVAGHLLRVPESAISEALTPAVAPRRGPARRMKP